MADRQSWLRKWLKIRKELYRQTEAEVRHRLGNDSAELACYRQEYESEFDKKWAAVQKEELLLKIQQSKLILMGDFHALQQSQKAHLRILKQLPVSTSKVLALECFQAQDQVHLDSYVQGKGSEREFLKAIGWAQRWGFPWEHYRPLLRWAQKNKVKVYGINTSIKKKSAVGLRQRDIFAAKQISEILMKHPGTLCFAIYGDLHLAQKHLPAEILKIQGAPFQKNMLRIFQNAEKIYFQMLGRELESTIDIVRISRQDYCLMSVPPWVKWQNYLMYLEQTYDLELDGEEILDYTDHVGKYVKIMSDELGANVSNDSLSVYTASDPLFWEKVEEHFQGKDLKWIENLVEEACSFYLPELGIAYLARASVNHAASLAMQFVHAKLSARTRSSFEMPMDFQRQIWIEAISYFGSKLINYKRKTDTITDIKASLSSRHCVDQGKEALMLALAQKMYELMMISSRSPSRSFFVPKKKWSYMHSATLLGGILGERLYAGYRKNMIGVETLISFLKKNTEDGKFDFVYYEMLEIIEALPAPFKSKGEKI